MKFVRERRRPEATRHQLSNLYRGISQRLSPAWPVEKTFMTIESANFFRKTVAVLPSRHALPASGMRSSRTAAAFIFMLGVGCTEPEPPICEATDFTEEEVEVGGKIMKRQLLASVCGPAYALRTATIDDPIPMPSAYAKDAIV